MTCCDPFTCADLLWVLRQDLRCSIPAPPIRPCIPCDHLTQAFSLIAVSVAFGATMAACPHPLQIDNKRRRVGVVGDVADAQEAGAAGAMAMEGKSSGAEGRGGGSAEGMEVVAVAGGGGGGKGEADICESRVWGCDLKPPIGVIDLTRELSHKVIWLDGHWADWGSPSHKRRLRRQVRALLRGNFKRRLRRQVRAFLCGYLCVSKHFVSKLK